MSRRRRAIKRKTTPDPKYKSVTLAKFINRVMLHGKKSIATKIVYGALEQFTQKVKAEDTMTAFEQAMDNAVAAMKIIGSPGYVLDEDAARQSAGLGRRDRD